MPDVAAALSALELVPKPTKKAGKGSSAQMDLLRTIQPNIRAKIKEGYQLKDIYETLRERQQLSIAFATFKSYLYKKPEKTKTVRSLKKAFPRNNLKSNPISNPRAYRSDQPGDDVSEKHDDYLN